MNGRRTRNAETDHLLRGALQQPLESSGGDDCPTPELLAAFVERSLDQDEAAAVEAHASSCGRCQEVLAAFIQTLPPSESTRVSWWSEVSAWGLGWLVPAGAVAAAALAVYIATNRGDRAVEEPMQMASRIGESRAPGGELAPAAPPEPAPPVAPGPMEPLRKSTAREAISAERKADAVASQKSVTSQESEGLVAADAGAPHEREEVAAQAAPAPVQELAADAPSKRFMARAKAGPAWIEADTPDGLVRVRVGAGGAIERSDDRGVTWAGQSSGVSTDLTAVAPLSPQLCWAVGRQGTVLRTTDGVAWVRRPFPAEIDLVAISATDAQVATVTAADGRRFGTRDGGTTWQALP